MRAVEAQLTGATRDKELELLGRKREMRGIFEGDLEEGELEMGQSSGLVKDIPTVEAMMQRLLSEYDQALARMNSL
jgi:enoyl-[acyl-carrier protein] reductase II